MKLKTSTARRKLQASGLFIRPIDGSGFSVAGMAHDNIDRFFENWVTPNGTLRTKPRRCTPMYQMAGRLPRWSALIRKLKVLGLFDPNVIDLMPELPMVRSSWNTREILWRISLEYADLALTSAGTLRKKYTPNTITKDWVEGLAGAV